MPAAGDAAKFTTFRSNLEAFLIRWGNSFKKSYIPHLPILSISRTHLLTLELSSLLFLAFEINSLPLFIQIGIELCDHLVKLDLDEQAALILASLYSQAHELCLYSVQRDILKLMSKLCVKLKDIELALRFSLKIVEFEWYLED